MLGWLLEHAAELRETYGTVSAQSVGASQRALVAAEDDGVAGFFGEPSVSLGDWLAHTLDGRGYVNILDASSLVRSPRVYSMFLLWMLSELYETLPEVGVSERPRLVFFFDEAQLLFDGRSRGLEQKIVQVVRLIRSKGVGVYFSAQTAQDIPDAVLSQLANRVQHGLMGITPRERRAIKAAAEGFRQNPDFDSRKAIEELATGEALVSFLDSEGRPSMVQRAQVLFPHSSIDAASPACLSQVRDAQFELMARYGTAYDRESAYERLESERAMAAETARLALEREQLQRERDELEERAAKGEGGSPREARGDGRSTAGKVAGRTAVSMLGAAGREATRQIVRGLFSTLKK